MLVRQFYSRLTPSDVRSARDILTQSQNPKGALTAQDRDGRTEGWRDGGMEGQRGGGDGGMRAS